jgi:uncharacterized protein YoxC
MGYSQDSMVYLSEQVIAASFLILIFVWVRTLKRNKQKEKRN